MIGGARLPAALVAHDPATKLGKDCFITPDASRPLTYSSE